MNLPAQDSLTFLLPHSLMYVGADRGASSPAPRDAEGSASGRQLARAAKSAVVWLIDLPARRAAEAELMALSDRELSDIGLSRADIYTVVTRSSATIRQAL